MKYAGAGIVVVAGAAEGAYYGLKPAPPVTTATETTAATSTSLEPAILRALVFDFDWSLPFATVLPDLYAQATGERVSMKAEMYPYISMHEKFVSELAGQSDRFDMFATDCIWVGEVVGKNWAYCLEDIQNENADLPKIDWSVFTDAALVYPRFNPEGKLWGLPTNNSNQVVAYRKDIFEQYGIGAPAKNWKDYREIAKALTIEKNGKVEMYGTTVTQAGQDPGYSDWTFRIFGFGPFEPGQKLSDGFILNDNKEVIFGTGANRDVSIWALDELKSIMPYTPPGALAYDYPDTASAYQEGKLAMICTWNDTFAGAEDPAVSKVVGMSGYTPIPYEKENWQSVGMCGPIWVNKYISLERAKENFRFLAWMTENNGQAWDTLMQTGGSVAPVLKKQLSDPEILSRLPVVAAYPEMKNFVPIPVMWPEFTEIQRIIWEEVSMCLANKKTSTAAIDDAQARSAKVMKAS